MLGEEKETGREVGGLQLNERHLVGFFRNLRITVGHDEERLSLPVSLSVCVTFPFCR